ncbi:hypothetical protein GYA49_01925 [Candidatus Beckwithbacteria bacterium]|nr:hypothetical protein [Candidatus Beckwithbacteria bacterium]
MQTLKKLGLSDTEIILYQTLFKTGPISITQLAKKCHIPRTTTYENIEKLIHKRLVNYLVKESNKKVLAKHPIQFEKLLFDQKIQLKNQTKKLADLEKELPSIISSLSAQTFDYESDFEVKVFEGKDSIQRSIYQEVLNSELVFSFSNLEKYYEVFPDSVSNWVDSYITNSTRQYWDITLNTNFAKELEPIMKQVKRYHYKFLPQSNALLAGNYADYLFYNYKIALIELEPRKVRAILIYSKHLYDGFVNLHKTMWELIPTI